uniref:Alpha/beta hydrolase fold-3 domain-containing protein n=1 Tax=Kalanchoe fedtschenkoi TaxID=63787 RepID=A0A7N0V080_KALFE
MGSNSTEKEVAHDVFPYLRQYKDGSVERLNGTATCPPNTHPHVLSKDVIIDSRTGISARLYLPKNINKDERKLPLFVYFHGGAFLIASPAEPLYDASLNTIVAQANVVAVSVDYRLAPEHPLPTAYDDCWSALQWISAHASSGSGGGSEAWLTDHVDFSRVYLAGDSAGANIAHHVSFRAADADPEVVVRPAGIVMIHPYFWSKDPTESELSDPVRKGMVDKWWIYACPSEKGCDDPLINPYADGSPSLAGLGCERLMVCVAEKDILCDRGRVYYESVVRSGWRGRAELFVSEGEDHVFHIFNPQCQKAMELIKSVAEFVNSRD